MKQTNWTQMFNKKSTNTPLLLRNCASKNSLKTLFKVNAQAKISLNKLHTLFRAISTDKRAFIGVLGV